MESQPKSPVCEIRGYFCSRNMKYVSEDKSYARILSGLQGQKSGLIGIHENNGAIVNMGKCECPN